MQFLAYIDFTTCVNRNVYEFEKIGIMPKIPQFINVYKYK